jgi:hypothetical protein
MKMPISKARCLYQVGILRLRLLQLLETIANCHHERSEGSRFFATFGGSE